MSTFTTTAAPRDDDEPKIVTATVLVDALERSPGWSVVMPDTCLRSRQAQYASSPKMLALRNLAEQLLQKTLEDVENPIDLVDDFREQLRRIRLGRHD